MLKFRIACGKWRFFFATYCINGLVPYPGILRACIKTTVDHFKNFFPENFIRVNVDHANLALKVNYRVKDGINKPSWKSCCGAILLPDLVLDTSARAPPVGSDLFTLLKLDKLDTSTRIGAAADSMDTSALAGSQGEVIPSSAPQVDS